MYILPQLKIIWQCDLHLAKSIIPSSIVALSKVVPWGQWSGWDVPQRRLALWTCFFSSVEWEFCLSSAWDNATDTPSGVQDQHGGTKDWAEWTLFLDLPGFQELDTPCWHPVHQELSRGGEGSGNQGWFWACRQEGQGPRGWHSPRWAGQHSPLLTLRPSGGCWELVEAVAKGKLHASISPSVDWEDDANLKGCCEE